MTMIPELSALPLFYDIESYTREDGQTGQKVNL